RPGGFSVMTGEDSAFFDALCHGAVGGFRASAHIRTGDFARVQRLVEAGGVSMGLGEWSKLLPTIRMLFSEPSPAALKHWLWRQGLIASAEMRLPMVPASQNLRARIDAEIAMPMEKAG
ncbi:MAG: dihydrodipicolinate synthase family protein, partial [Flavobacteriaceae bacterium]